MSAEENSIRDDDLLLAVWRLEGGATNDGSIAGNAALSAYASIKDSLCRPDPPLCICVEGADGAGKTTCCDAAFRDAGVTVQLWDSRECATATLNSTQIGVRSRNKGGRGRPAAKRLLPSVGIDVFVRDRGEEEEKKKTRKIDDDTKPLIVLVDNIHEVLRDDKSAFATMLRTLRSARGSNNQLTDARRTIVVITLNRDELDQRLYAQLRRECHSPNIVRIDPPTTQETLQHIVAVLPALTDEESRVLESCAEEAAASARPGVRSTLSLFRDAVSTAAKEEEEGTKEKGHAESDVSAFPDSANRVAKAKAAVGLFSAMCRAHADDDGRPDDLWRSMTDAMKLQVKRCELIMYGGGGGSDGRRARTKRRC